MSLRDMYQRLTGRSVDPNGWGVPHNTEVNRTKNAMKSTDAITSEIEARNAEGKPTWQLRQELLRRARSEEDYDDE